MAVLKAFQAKSGNDSYVIIRDSYHFRETEGDNMCIYSNLYLLQFFCIFFLGGASFEFSFTGLCDNATPKYLTSAS